MPKHRNERKPDPNQLAMPLGEVSAHISVEGKHSDRSEREEEGYTDEALSRRSSDALRKAIDKLATPIVAAEAEVSTSPADSPEEASLDTIAVSAEAEMAAVRFQTGLIPGTYPSEEELRARERLTMRHASHHVGTNKGDN